MRKKKKLKFEILNLKQIWGLNNFKVKIKSIQNTENIDIKEHCIHRL